VAKIGLDEFIEGVVEGIASRIPKLPSVRIDAIFPLSDNSQGSRGTSESSVRCASGFRFSTVMTVVVTID